MPPQCLLYLEINLGASEVTQTTESTANIQDVPNHLSNHLSITPNVSTHRQSDYKHARVFDLSFRGRYTTSFRYDAYRRGDTIWTTIVVLSQSFWSIG